MFSTNSYAYNFSVENQIILNTPESLREKSIKYVPMIVKVSQELNIDPYLAYSIAWTETHFNPRISSAGANGLFQVMPSTKKWIKKKWGTEISRIITGNMEIYQKNPIDFENIVLGLRYLKYLLNRFEEQKMAIIAYNMGPNYVASMIELNLGIGENHQYFKKISRRYKIIAKN
tara:strand:+ start:35892 stop:36413 length:522 start_codon:yes stop_codon:yes gene_type:complete